ncbi:MAG: hypothetical protein FD180_4208 [Planctomycetota bacterium]|nr:MAG: hypothetical protein FD180_4208 [Planctomycetota bacterium]
MFRSARWWAWLACGIGVGLVAFRLASLSEAFVWGDKAGRAARPLVEVILLWMGGWLLYAGALRLGAALPPRVPSLVALLLVAAGARAAFFGTNPIQEDDAYRYLWDGQVVLEGVDPYRWSPAEVAATGLKKHEREGVWSDPWRLPEIPAEVESPPPDLARLSGLVAGFHPDRTGPSPGKPALENFRKINNARVPTIYPPLNMPVFALGQKLTPWRLDGLRAVFLALELATVALLWFALRAAGANPMWAAVYAWCPMTIKEMANSPHHDALVVCMLAAFLLCAVAEKPRLAAAALALATAAKLYPIVLVPVLLAWAWRRDRRSAIASGATFAAVLLACYAPFLHSHTFRGAGVFASGWNSNAGAFSLIDGVCTKFLGKDPIAFGGGQAPRGNLYARAIAAALVCGAVAAAALTPRFRKPAIAPVGRAWDLPFRCTLAFAAGFALAPAQHPWYFAGILPFIALFPYRSWILLTGTLALYYSRFYFTYDPSRWDRVREAFGNAPGAPWNSERDFAWVRLVEYTPFYALLAWEGFSGWLKGAEAEKSAKT